MIIISNKKVARIVNLQMDSANWTGNLAHLHPRSSRLQTCKSSYKWSDERYFERHRTNECIKPDDQQIMLHITI